MIKKSPMNILTIALIIIAIITACAPSATAQLPIEKVDTVTCFNSDAVVVTKNGADIGIVPELPAPVNNESYYAQLQKDGNFVSLLIAREGSTFEYNGNISVRNIAGAIVIVTDSIENTCVPKTVVVPINGSYQGLENPDPVQKYNTCGNETQTGDRILLSFTDRLILLSKVEGGFTTEDYSGQVVTESNQNNVLLQAMRGEWETILTDITVCYTNNSIGVEIEEYPRDFAVVFIMGDWYVGWILDPVYWPGYEILDSNVCRKTSITSILVFFTRTNEHDPTEVVDYELGTGADLQKAFGPEKGKLNVSVDHDPPDAYSLDIAENLPTGKAVQIKYTDQNGTVTELPLVENCGTYLSMVYK